jgi:hypothetical protein
MANKILLPGKTYTFRSYFKMRFSIVDILRELGVEFQKGTVNISPSVAIDPEHLRALDQRVRAASARVNLSSEAARREAVIFPVLFEIAESQGAQIEIEYAIDVNQYLKGELDYLLRNQRSSIVVEAKNADLVHGFTQLAVELIALDAWTNSTAPILYGAVTTGDMWQLGSFDRNTRVITQDPDLYRVPADLAALSTWLNSSLITPV